MHWCECAHAHSNITFSFWGDLIVCVCGGVECVCVRVPWRVREIQWHLVEERVSLHMWGQSTGLSPLIDHHGVFVHLSVSLGFLPILYCELWVMLLPARVSTDLLSVLRIYPEVGLLGYGVVLILFFEEPPHCFPEQLHHFVRHTRGFQFPSAWLNTTLPVCLCLFW